MDNYCRTCMRDSNKFSQIFEEMTYGGISLEEAIEDVCQLEISFGEDLPSYVCRDCSLKIYDIVKFKMEVHEVYSAMRKLVAIQPRIKVEIDESIEEASLLSPKTENINVEEFRVSHSVEDSYNNVIDQLDNATTCYAGNANCETTLSSVKVENSIIGTDAFEVPYKTVTDRFGNATISYAENANCEPTLSSVKVENSIIGTDSFEDEIPRLILEDSDKEEEIVAWLPSMPAVERRTLEVPESIDKGNRSEEIFQNNTQGITEGKKNLCSQTLYANGKEFDEIQIENRNSDSKDVSLTCFDHRVSLLVDYAEGEGNLTSREKYCHSDGTHLLPERAGEKDTSERESVARNTYVKQSEAEHEGRTSNLSETTTASVGLDTCVPTGVESYICHVCDKSFPKKSALKKHERIHLVEKHFECGICNRKFRMECTLKTHRKIHEIFRRSLRSDDRNDIEASRSSELDKLPTKVDDAKCKNIIKNSTLLVDSNVPLNGGQNMDYSKSLLCDCCGKEFGNKKDLLEHLNLHYGRRSSSKRLSAGVGKTAKNVSLDLDYINKRGSNVFQGSKVENVLSRSKSRGKKSVSVSAVKIAETVGKNSSAEKKFACKYCSKMFTRSNCRNKHERIHTGEKPFACRHCSKMFISSSQRNLHEVVHSEERPFACEYCSKMFKRSHDRNQHQLIHTGEKPFACRHCSKAFRSQTHRKIHERVHSGEKPFACSYCSKMFRCVSSRKRHELSHTGEKPFACKYCSKSYRTVSERNIHEVIHTGEKQFACKYCPKLFWTTFQRKQHELIHSERRPFACKHCSKMFKRASIRNDHERVHSEEKPFSCKHCSKSFRCKRSVKRHETVHNGVR